MADRNAYIPNTLLRVRPLYFGAAPAQRQPLSDERIEEGACQAGYNVYKLTAFVEGARFAEAAHNITAAPAAQKGEKL